MYALNFVVTCNHINHSSDVPQSKAVPLHAIVALGGRGDIAPSHS
jgi:hypothetical protein